MISRLKEQLIIDEGFVAHPYRCTEGFLTIGCGRNIQTKGISKEEALYLLENDIMEVVVDMRQIFDDFHALPEDIQYVCCNMCFQLGDLGFKRFKKLIAAIKNRDWQRAAAEMINSRWYKQTTNRAERLVQIVKGVS